LVDMTLRKALGERPVFAQSGRSRQRLRTARDAAPSRSVSSRILCFIFPTGRRLLLTLRRPRPVGVFVAIYTVGARRKPQGHPSYINSQTFVDARRRVSFT
jgi:hypothetical protein